MSKSSSTGTMLVYKILAMIVAGASPAVTLLIFVFKGERPESVTDELYYSSMVLLPALSLSCLAFLWLKNGQKATFLLWLVGAFLSMIASWMVIETVL